MQYILPGDYGETRARSGRAPNRGEGQGLCSPARERSRTAPDVDEIEYVVSMSDGRAEHVLQRTHIEAVEILAGLALV